MNVRRQWKFNSPSFILGVKGTVAPILGGEGGGGRPALAPWRRMWPGSQ
jgi:hypothetical protein